MPGSPTSNIYLATAALDQQAASVANNTNVPSTVRYLGNTTLAARTVTPNNNGTTTLGPTYFYTAAVPTSTGSTVGTSYQAASSSNLTQNMAATNSTPTTLVQVGNTLVDPFATSQTVATPTTTTVSALATGGTGGTGSTGSTSGSTNVVSTPASAQSPADVSSTGSDQTAANDSVLGDLASIIAGLSVGQNAAAANTGAGVGTSDTSLPSPTAADVAALQPTVTDTSSSGPSIWLILGVVVVAGVGIYFWYRSKHSGGGE